MSRISGGKASLLCVLLSIISGVCVDEEDVEKWYVPPMSVSVTEGDSLILPSHFNETLTIQHIVWAFGDQDSDSEKKIATRKGKHPPIYEPVDQFRDRLMMDRSNGSLTITNITTEDAGPYRLIIISRLGKNRRFRVSVYARLPVPVITRNPCSSSVCEVVCSVENVRNVTLSWYKGESLISSISVSDLSRRVSLPLEIESLNDSYVCVLNNTITQQSTHLNVSQICSDSFSWLWIFLAVVLLVLMVVCVTFACFRKKTLLEKMQRTPAQTFTPTMTSDPEL